jgi:hypothetical protein
LHETRPALHGVLLEDERIVNEASIEDKAMGARDKEGGFLVVRVVDGGIGTSAESAHSRTVDLMEVTVPKGSRKRKHYSA